MSGNYLVPALSFLLGAISLKLSKIKDLSSVLLIVSAVILFQIAYAELFIIKAGLHLKRSHLSWERRSKNSNLKTR